MYFVKIICVTNKVTKIYIIIYFSLSTQKVVVFRAISVRGHLPDSAI